LYDESGAGYNPTNYQNATTSRGHDHLHHVLAGWQHGRADPIGISGVRVRHADRAVGPGYRWGRTGDWVDVTCGRDLLSSRRVDAEDARERVHAVERRRLDLVPDVHGVIAFVLRVVRQRALRRPAVQGVVIIQVVGLVKQRK